MDFQSAMETFAEAWVAANTKGAEPVSNGAQVKIKYKKPTVLTNKLHSFFLYQNRVRSYHMSMLYTYYLKN